MNSGCCSEDDQVTTGMKPEDLGIRDCWETCVRDLDRPRANDRLPVDTSDALASGFLAADFAGYLSGCLSGPCAIGGGTTRDGDQFHWDEASRDSCGAILDGFATVGAPGRRAEERRHRVTLTASFYLGVHEVTQEQYVRVMKQNPSEFARDGVQGARVREQVTEHFPVDSVNWNQAVQFCLRLSELPKERSADRSYRLLAETEWEYAARAGTDTIWSFGRHQEQLSRYAWYWRSSDRRTHTVGEKRPNAWGATTCTEMSGNGFSIGLLRRTTRSVLRRIPPGPLEAIPGYSEVGMGEWRSPLSQRVTCGRSAFGE